MPQDGARHGGSGPGHGACSSGARPELGGLDCGRKATAPGAARRRLQSLRERPKLLVGGGGTGKTSTCRAIVEAWEGLGGRVEMAALSGKAALRLTEGTGRLGRNCRPALTIHRLLLGLRKRRDGATHWLTPGVKPDAASELPLLDVRTLLVLDEASMIGLGEMHQILEAMPAGCRLLLVGDPFQLPPVSFGVCFHRLVEVERITARLTTIHRQSEASGIPAVAASVRARSMPDLLRFAGAAPGVFMLPCAREDVDAAVEEVIKTLDPEGTFAELLVVAALNERGSGSVLSLNTRCHDAHVKRTQAQGVRGWLGQRFAAGEPVVHLRNDYQRGLRNGSMGRIIAVGRGWSRPDGTVRGDRPGHVVRS
ncbi:ATP-dependent DNA helicase [Methylobacterium tardum]|uniref:ATP-dependent DNA helicase n=1 Tax=Methylobacterium tardum TaxID=374432 RepID=UPI00325FACE9